MEDKKTIEAMKALLEDTVSKSAKLPGERFVQKNPLKSPGSLVYEALEKKTFYKEPNSDTILAFTDDTLIEVTPRIADEIIGAIEKFSILFKRRAKKDGINCDSVSEILGIYEGAYAAYLNTPRYEKLRKDMITFLKEQYDNGDEKTQKEMNKGFIKFFSLTKANISRGFLKFPNMKFRVNKNGDRLLDESIMGLSIKVEEDKESLRNEFIFKALEDGLWSYDYLFESGIINGLGGYDVNAFVRTSNVLTPEQKVNAFIVSGVCDDREEVLDYYKKEDKRFFLEIANVTEVVDALKDGSIDMKDASRRLKIKDVKDLTPEKLEELLSIPNFPRNTEFLQFVPNKKTNRTDRFISKALFKELNREQIMKIVFSEKVNQVYLNPLESENYINMIGKLKIDDIKKLEENGFILPEDVIKLSKFKVLDLLDSEEYSKMLEYVAGYYDLNRIEELHKEDKIYSSFVRSFNEDVLAKLDEEKRKEYFSRFYEDLKQKENNETLFVELVKKGFDIPAREEYKVSFDTISEMYLEEKISEDDIMSFYKKQYISAECIKNMYSSSDILDNYRNGNLDVSFLNFVDDRQTVIRKELEAGRITLEDVILLYSDKEGIDINELQYIFEKQSLENDNLAEFIPDDMDEKKIEGLFECYFISHDDLSVLVSRGIISSEDAEKYANKMVTHDVLESIFGNATKAMLTRDTETGESRTHGLRIGPNKRAGQIKNDPELEEMLLNEVGFDDRRLVLSGENNSLDGYTVCASDKYGLMVFSNYDKPGNATYVMSLQQGLFFLNRLMRKRSLEDGTVEEKVDGVQSSATKQELRETEHVKVRNASRWLGRNIVDSMRKISDKFARDYRKEKNYRDKIDEIVDAIRDDYDTRKKESK